MTFLSPLLEVGLDAALVGYRVEVRDTILAWDREGHSLDVRALSVTMRDNHGVVLATLPAVDVVLSLRALLRGLVSLKAVQIKDAKLSLVRDVDGALHFGVADASAPQAAPILPGLLARLLAVPQGRSPLGALHEVRLLRGELTIHDQRLDRTWHIPQTNVVVQRHRTGFRARLWAAPSVQQTRVTVAAEASYRQAQQRLELQVLFANLPVPALAHVIAGLEGLKGLDMRTQGVFALALERGGVHDASFNIEAGAGQFSAPGSLSEPIPIDHIRVRGRVDMRQQRLHVDDAVIRLQAVDGVEPLLQGSGIVNHLKGGLTAQGHVMLQALSLPELYAYWPVAVAPATRTWLVKNLVTGRVEQAQVHVGLHWPEGLSARAQLSHLDGLLQYQGLEVHYLRPLPAVVNIAGHGSFDRRGFRLGVTTGAVAGQRLTAGEVRITGLDQKQKAMAIRAHVAGPLEPALTLLNHPRLALLSRLGIEPARMQGHMHVQTALDFALKRRLRMAEIDVNVRGQLEDVTMRHVILGQHLTQGHLGLDLDRQGMRLEGDANLAAIPLHFVWREAFSRHTAWRRDMQVTAPRITHADRMRLGLALGDVVTGPIAMMMQGQMGWEGDGLLQAQLDLQDTALRLPWLGEMKAMREPGQASATLRLASGRPVALDALAIDSGQWRAQGRARLHPSSTTLAELTLHQLALRQSTLHEVSIKRQGDGIDIFIGGGVLDAQPLVQVIKGMWTEAQEPVRLDMPLRLRTPGLRRVIFGPGRVVNDVKIMLTRQQTGWELIDIAGEVAVPPYDLSAPAANGEAAATRPKTFSLRYHPTAQDTYRLAGFADDMGATLRALNLTDTIAGGHLSLDGDTAGSRSQPSLRMVVKIKDFVVRDAPILARILAAASLPGLMNTLNHDGLKMTHLAAAASLQDGTLVLEKLRAHGGSLGITARGDIDYAGSNTKLQGTVVPAYGLNSLLSHVPGLNLLVGGRGQGLIAVNYHVTGRLNDPQVFVNPISLLTPGVLRKLFDLVDETDQTPSAPPNEAGTSESGEP